MKNLSWIVVAMLAIFMSLSMIGCEESSDQKDAKRTEELQSEASRQVGVPNITNWKEKKLAKRIYEMRDQEKLLTYTYTVGMDAIPVFLCRSMGYGLPYATQFTNPEKEVHVGHNLPQAEPNGLFMPSSAEATWVFAIDDEGKEHILYVEPRVIVSTFLLPNAKYPNGKPGAK